MSYTVASNIYEGLTEKQREQLDFHLWSCQEDQEFKNDYQDYQINSKNKWKNHPTDLTTNKTVVQ
jgi:hypothetical protein